MVWPSGELWRWRGSQPRRRRRPVHHDLLAERTAHARQPAAPAHHCRRGGERHHQRDRAVRIGSRQAVAMAVPLIAHARVIAEAV